MEDEEELRTKLAADIEKYQRDASISSATVAPTVVAPSNDVKGKAIDVTVDEIVSPIASGKIKLLEFIEALGPTISTKDPLVRSKSVRLLSLTLGRLAIDTALLDGEIRHLFQFLLARIEDHHLVAPAALLGLRALSSSTRLSVEDCLSLLRSIFEHLDVQSLAQIDRFSVYVILRNLLANHLPSIQTHLGPNFVHGFIQTMDGEKDPRNLVICFQLSEKISQTFPLATFAEDAFEVVACYFPIDFNPPKNDPFGITREKLVDGLRNAMTASPLFAQYCLPLLIEKLSSDLSSAKVDALKTISAGAAIFGAKGLREHLQLLVNDMRREMFATTSDAIQKAVEEAATAIARTIADDRSSNDFPELLPHFTALIMKECGVNLNEPQHRLMYSASRFLLAFCRGSLFVTIRVIQTCFPSLHHQFLMSPQLNSRCPIVEVIGKFLTVLCDHVNPLSALTETQNSLPLRDGSQRSGPSLALSDITIEEVPPRSLASPSDVIVETKKDATAPSHPAPFQGFQDDSGELVDIRGPVSEILAASLVGDCEERLCLLGLTLSECWLRLPDAVADDEARAKTVFPIVSLAVFHASPQVRSRATDVIRKLAFISVASGASNGSGGGEENIFDAQVLPLLMNHLTEVVSQSGFDRRAMRVDAPGDRGCHPAVNIVHLSSLLSRCCLTPQGFALATDKLLTAIETQGASSSHSCLSSSSPSSGASLGLVLLECLDSLAEKGIDSNPANQRVLKDKVLPRVKSIFIDDWDSTRWLRQPEVVARGAALTRKVVEIMTQDEATAEWNETKGLLGRHMFGSEPSDVSRRNLFPLLLSIGSSVPRGCQIHCSDSAFLDGLFRLAAAPSTDAALAADYAKLSAAIVNKIDNDAALTTALDKIVDAVTRRRNVSENEKDDGRNDESRMVANRDFVSLNGVTLWIWVTKALVLRSHRSSKQFTARLVSWLGKGGGGGGGGRGGGGEEEEEDDDDAPAADEIATMISRTGFVTILTDTEDVFSVRQHAISRKMYKQRFFLQTIPSLIRKKNDDDHGDGLKEEELKKSEQHRLNALASMLPYLPQQALLSELPSILPVLVKSLTGDDAVLQKSVIDCLELLLKESPLALASNADAVIPKLIHIAKASPSMDARSNALRCLGSMVASASPSTSPMDSSANGLTSASGGLAPSLLMPHKLGVVRELSKCLDDKKRLVRREAVLTRNKWFLI